MKAIWKGTINFAMVSIPAKLFSATDDNKVSFHQYHATCGSRVQMPKWCPVCQRKLEATEIKRGYEISKEQHIILEEADFQSLPLKSLKTIEVVEFVDSTQIDVRAYADCYLLSCEDVGAKAFTLFLKAMQSLGLVGIAKLCYREREHLSAIRPYDGIMLLQTLHYADEIRPYDELKPRQVAVSDKEMELASGLIKAMTAERFDLAKYHDDYREALEKLIEAKLAGKVISAPVEQEAPASDVVEALLKSLNLVGAK
jgi:DNA end-binding protein Ku